MDFLIDIGNVLLPFNFIPAFQKLLPPETHNPDEIFARLIEKKDAFESGKIATSDYIEWASGELGFHGTQEEFARAWCDIFTVNQPMWDLMHRLKADGHRLIIFSNTNALHGPDVLVNYPDFALFDALVFSYEVGAIKPEPRIYEYAIETYQLDPQSTYYIDDLTANIARGESYGIQCHQYDPADHEACLQWLREAELLTQ